MHWGTYKTYMNLKRKGINIPYVIVKEVCKECEICTKFRPEVARSKWHQVLYSENPGKVIYADVIGPLPTRRGGFKYLHCIIDSATKMAKVEKLRIINSKKVILSLESWIKRYSPIGTIVTDNASYYASGELSIWCKELNT